MFNHRTSINLFYMVDKLFTVYTNINIEMKTAVRGKDVVLKVFKFLFKGLFTHLVMAMKCEYCRRYGKVDMSHSQMLGKFEYTLPAKF